MKSKIQKNSKSNFIIGSNKLIIAALLIVGFTSFAQNQTPTDKKANKGQKEKMTAEQKGQRQLEKWTEDLKLDAKQQEQIKPILAEQIAKNQALRTERMGTGEKPKELSSEERNAFRQKRLDEKMATENKLKAILTPEQFKKMKDMETANREANRERMKEFNQDRPERGERPGRQEE